jgi:hypothetical protein
MPIMIFFACPEKIFQERAFFDIDKTQLLTVDNF